MNDDSLMYGTHMHDYIYEEGFWKIVELDNIIPYHS